MERPLGAFSDFVVENLPRILRSSDKIRIAATALRELEQLDETTLILAFNTSRELARLDLVMLEWALYHSKLAIPVRLTKLVEHFSKDRSLALTYEDLVFVNPRGDMRTFSEGEHGYWEWFFYRNHRDIEETLMLVIDRARTALSKKTLAMLRNPEVPHSLAVVLRKTALLRDMPDGQFEAFRKYLMSREDCNLRGPSGAFSARIPVLEMLLRGVNEERLDYLAQNQQYFPERDRDLLAYAIGMAKRGDTLRALAQGSDDEAGPVGKLEAFFTKWRQLHMSAVARQLPKVWKGQDEGTSGETDVRRFLMGRLTDY